MSSQQSLGERRVRVSFNPSDNSVVDVIKGETANLIDACDGLKANAKDSEAARCAELAQTKYEEAAMWAVKAATA